MFNKSLLLVITLLVIRVGSAFSQLVSTPQELQAAIAAATPGTEIILKNQVWTDLVINVNVVGTADQPIIIKAENAGAVFLEGNSSVNLGGSYIIFTGVIFRNAAGLISSNGRIDHCCDDDYHQYTC